MGVDIDTISPIESPPDSEREPQDSGKKEIELKVRPDATLAEIEGRCQALGWRFLGEQRQEDVYYTSRFKDFILTEECLRIRRSGDVEQLTWKPGTSAQMRERGQYWKPEIDVDIRGQVDEVRLMFQHLEFVEYAVVRKQRRTYRVDEHTIVALDEIDEVGAFVEIESVLHSPSQGVRRNDEVAAMLGVGDSELIMRPYRDLVKDAQSPEPQQLQEPKAISGSPRLPNRLH